MVLNAASSASRDLAAIRAAMRPDIAMIMPRLLALYYGDTGTGKTIYALRLAAAITPPDKKILYIDTGQGYMSILNHKRLYDQLRPRMTVLPFTGEHRLQVVHSALANRVDEFDEFGTVVWDEASSMFTGILGTVSYGRALKDSKRDDPELQTQPDYLIAGNKFQKLVTDYSTLDGVHFLMTAHYRTDKNKLGKDKYAPNFIPYVNQEIRKPLHIIGHMENNFSRDGKYTRTIQVHPTDTCTAKSRVGGFADEPVTDPEKYLRATVEWLLGGRETEPEPDTRTEETTESTKTNLEEIQGIEVE